jgi:hypothetical protein
MIAGSRKRRREEDKEEEEWRASVRADYRRDILSRSPADQLWFSPGTTLTKQDIMAMGASLNGAQDLVFFASKENTAVPVMAIRMVSDQDECVRKSRRHRADMVKVAMTEQFMRIKQQYGMACGGEFITSFASLATEPVMKKGPVKTSVTYPTRDGILWSEVVDFDKRTNGKQQFEVYVADDSLVIDV